MYVTMIKYLINTLTLEKKMTKSIIDLTFSCHFTQDDNTMPVFSKSEISNFHQESMSVK